MGAATADHRFVKTEDQAVAAGGGVVPDRWQTMFQDLMGRIANRFVRVEPLLRTRQLVLGLLSDLSRKNCWTIAEHTGDASPDGLQHLLGRAKWDADLVQDDMRTFVLEHLADDQAVLVVDETGGLKKGTHTVGVQRQYTGTAGRIENAQAAVYLTYASRHGHAGIDRSLYLPRSWSADPERCPRAAVPEEIGFATKPQLAQHRAWAARCGCSRARARSPRSWCRSCSGLARRRTTCSPLGRLAGWREAHEHWRRGVEAAVICARARRPEGPVRVPGARRRRPGGGGRGVAGLARRVPSRAVDRGCSPLLRPWARGDMDEARVEQLEKLGMVWSHFDVAWEEGLAAARGWAAEAGHLLAPLDATRQGYRVGIWLKNARAAARKAAELEEWRAEGLLVESAAGALSAERREQLAEIDPS